MRREHRVRQTEIFKILMSQRKRGLDERGSMAFNLIPMEFDGKSPKSKKIIDCWRKYLDHSNHTGPDGMIWNARMEELSEGLILSISEFLGYRFTELQIKRDTYHPKGLADIQEEQTAIRAALLSVLRGEQALIVNTMTGGNR